MNECKILVVGTGGRENAIAEGLAKSAQVKEVIIARGNAGSELMKKCRRIKTTSIRAIEELREIAEKEDVDFTVVGPEAPISKGIADEFRKKGLEIIAPSKKAAILETSKCWTKDYLKKIGVPIPEYEIFKDPEKAKEFVKENPKMRVVKADGIAEGKGTFVCVSLEETFWAIDRIFSEDFNQRYNNAGRKIEIEEKLTGEEISFFVITDGEHVEFFGTARDYKKAFEEHERDRKTQRIINDFFKINPNTGGMGAISPHPLEKEVKEKVLREIVFPTIENFPYRKEYIGIIHFVVMIVSENGQKKPKVLEINVRDGDPEAQVRLPRLRSDLAEIYSALVEQRLDQIRMKWGSRWNVGVCAVSGPCTGRKGFYPGYPDDRQYTNQPICIKSKESTELLKWHRSLDINTYIKAAIYHNGTEFDQEGFLRTTGGRVLTVVGEGNTLQEAREITYKEIEKIYFKGIRWRKDIGLL